MQYHCGIGLLSLLWYRIQEELEIKEAAKAVAAQEGIEEDGKYINLIENT